MVTRLQVIKMLSYISLHLEVSRRTVPQGNRSSGTFSWKERRQCDDIILDRVTLGAKRGEVHAEDASKAVEERVGRLSS